MQFEDLAIVVPVKHPPDIEAFILGNADLFKSGSLVVVDSGGGEALEKLAAIYVRKDLKFWEARKLGYEKVTTDFTLNLDVDVVAPRGYVENALALLKKEADAVSIFYEDTGHCQGALEFGVSLWKTEVLRNLYDFSMDLVLDGKIVKVGPQTYSSLNNGWCECTYMFRRLKNAGCRLETLPYKARHLSSV